MERNKKLKIVIIILSILLAISLLTLAGIQFRRSVKASGPVVMVPDNIITPDAKQIEQNSKDIVFVATANADSASSDSGKKAEVISLYQKHAEDNQPFQVGNMFPGDAETKYYCVRISHSGEVVVHYRADIRPGYEKLAEVLKCRIVLLSTGETLYDGLMRDMPESLDHSVKADTDAGSELYYQITAYLDTSVGNDYQNKNLIADFYWWVQVDPIQNPEGGQGIGIGTGSTQNPHSAGHLNPLQTGDSFNLCLYIAIASGSLLIFLLLWKKIRKEECENG